MRIFILVIFFYPCQIYAQKKTDTALVRNIITFFPKQNKKVYVNGIGIGPILAAKPNSKINGLAIETPGLGILGQFGKGPDESISRGYIKINGISISPLGSFSNTNGINLSGFGTVGYQTNGLLISLGFSSIEKGNGIIISGFNRCNYLNGIQIGAFTNSRKARGLQIGITNEAEDFKGIQIGFWNVNSKRKFPFINWSF
jgi:hypothetical protein